MDKIDNVTDESLIVQYQSGDILALQKLVKRWHKLFCEKAYWMTKDAEASKDIAQESWTSIINNLHNLKDSSRFKSWALRIVFTKSMDWLRFNQMNRKKLEKYYKNYNDSDESTNSNETLKAELLNAVRLLPNEQQVVLRLFYVEEYTLKDISLLLEISVGTVKSRLFHAREKLKEQFKNRNYEN